MWSKYPNGLRKCRECDELKELELFYRHKDKPLGRDYVCKPCGRVYKSNKGFNSKKIYGEKALAVRMVRSAIDSGKLIRQPCEICGDAKSHGHHEDYSKPLDVIWLCPQHHMDVHRAKRNAVLK